MRRSKVSWSSVRFVLSAALVAAVVLGFAPAAALAQATFHAVGDLPGGAFSSQIRDATKVGNTILAVGSGNGQTPPLNCLDPCNSGDTAVLWRIVGTTVTPVALPNLVVNTSATNFVTASAITPDGAYIASRARSDVSSQFVSINNRRQAVRVTTALLSSPSANLNLGTSLLPALPPSTAAVAISIDGSILYGLNSAGRAVRFDVSNSSSLIIDPLVMNTSGVAARGTSSDGTVMVGSFTSSLDDRPFYSGRAFRYVQGSGAALIPLPVGGTWSGSIAVSPDGNLVLVAGDSGAYPKGSDPNNPKGEVYLYNATSGAITSLGSPNSAFGPSNVAGMTADASVVAMSFGGPTRNFSYFHNSHGWFLVASALGASGIDVKAQGWTELGLSGMSSDGTLVFGSGVHNNQVEGWVAEFPAGYLAAFDAPAAPVSNTSIVGAWRVNDTASGSPGIAVFMADGTYFIIQPTVDTATEPNAAPGFERGVYSWNATNGAVRVTTLNSTMGDAGLSDNNGVLDFAVFVSGDSFSLTPGGPAIGSRIKALTSPLKDTIVGAWVLGNPAVPDSSSVVVFDIDGTYYNAQDGSPADGGARDGIEKGTFTWNATSGALIATSIAIDTNGEAGLSNPYGDITVTPGVDGLTAQAGDASGTMLASRVIDPATVVPAITSALSANATLGAAFTYAMTASNDAFTFGATGLPAGLSIDGGTGAISGAPAVLGSFNVTLTASNTLSTGTATLNITVITTVTTASGSNVSVTPEVPAGTPPVTMNFSNVSQGGTTAMNVIDPATAPLAQAPPSGFSLGDPATYYEVSTTAVFAGPVTMCFNYAGVNFNGGTPRLFHYANGAWVDITTSVDSATTTVCGVTSSFSPFALFASSTPFITRTGFYSPVTMTTAFVNTAKGGSTVPLKFNVYVNGAEKTNTAGLQFSVASVGCSSAVAEDQVDWVTSEATSLRYDTTDRQFIQNWKTPKAAGTCYLARITTADGKSLSATFKLK